MPALLALFGWSKIATQAVAGWLSRRSLIEIVCLLLAVGWAIDHVASHRLAAKLQHQLTACSSARQRDRQSYADAQAKAQAANHAQVQKIEQLQEQINEASRNSFTADRDRLRAQSGAVKGSPGATGTPQVPHAAPGTPPEVVSLPPAELLRAQELELQLNALIDWVNQQAAIDRSASHPEASGAQQP